MNINKRAERDDDEHLGPFAIVVAFILIAVAGIFSPAKHTSCIDGHTIERVLTVSNGVATVQLEDGIISEIKESDLMQGNALCKEKIK